ncbi:MAG: M14 family metallopeptidase [Fidelibacterota bacterium]
MKQSKFTLLIVLSAGLVHLSAQSMRTHPAPGLGDYDAPFYPGGTYSSEVRSPSDFLGFPLGSRPATHREVVAYFAYLAETFPNATLHTYGQTYEGRRLVYLTVTSEKNARKLDSIQHRIGKLADPRKLGKNEAQRIIKGTPAVAWMAYAIHGDELSSTDAALQLAYQLLAGTDDVTGNIRDELVVCIDPLQNPDGRTRFLGQLDQWSSAIPSTDVQSLHHRGVWPWGRGNHYLFDLNRDWFVLVHPETQGKVTAILQWHPQLMVDAHEMGSYDTYLFNPPRKPFNPFMPGTIHKWWKIFSQDQAAAFDRYGWSYYTRDWNEELFPGYGSSWPIYSGAVGILYEQAGVDGSQVKRPDGTIMSYRESVHHQFTSSMANLRTASEHREELLEDYYSQKREAVGGRERPRSKGGVFLVPPGTKKSRLMELGRILQMQGIEVEEATEAFKVRGPVSSFNREVKEAELPKGTLIVRLNQPNRRLVEAILTFDIRIPTDFLEEEKKSLLKRHESRIYDVTGWSLPLAYNLEAYFSESVPAVNAAPFSNPETRGGIMGKSPRVGYAFSGADDQALVAVARLFEKGVNLWCSKEPFEVNGRKFPRGSFLIRLKANPDLEEADLEAVAVETGVTMVGVNTSLATTGSDLGGRDFIRLEPPRIALVGGNPVSTYSFGAIWHLLDSRINTRISLIHAMDLGRTDLRKYNVLVLPDVRGGPTTYKRVLGDGGIRRLKEWVRDGGTLVAMGTGAAFLADTSVALSGVRQRRQVLDKWSEFETALQLSREAEAPKVDSVEVWEGKEPEDKEVAEGRPGDLSRLRVEDETARKLAPGGAILLARMDDEHWLSFGSGQGVPVLINSSYAYVAKEGVEVAGRLSSATSLRLSGLLWPEARKRWSDTLYATREGLGKGQIILFATQPNFRGFFRGGERLLLNALFLGPGFGTRPSVGW